MKIIALKFLNLIRNHKKIILKNQNKQIDIPKNKSKNKNLILIQNQISVMKSLTIQNLFQIIKKK
jgi:hypothetical protein